MVKIKINQGGRKMKNKVKQFITFTLAMLMMLSIPLDAFAAGFRYKDLQSEKNNFINSMPVDKAAKFDKDPESKQEANQQIKDVDYPALYTIKADYNIQRGGTKQNRILSPI